MRSTEPDSRKFLLKSRLKKVKGSFRTPEEEVPEPRGEPGLHDFEHEIWAIDSRFESFSMNTAQCPDQGHPVGSSNVGPPKCQSKGVVTARAHH
jgi:hypothetical protein